MYVSCPWPRRLAVDLLCVCYCSWLLPVPLGPAVLLPHPASQHETTAVWPRPAARRDAAPSPLLPPHPAQGGHSELHETWKAGWPEESPAVQRPGAAQPRCSRTAHLLLLARRLQVLYGKLFFFCGKVYR